MTKTLPFIPAVGLNVLVINNERPFWGTLIGWGTIGCTVVPQIIREWMKPYLMETEEDGEIVKFIQCSWDNVRPC